MTNLSFISPPAAWRQQLQKKDTSSDLFWSLKSPLLTVYDTRQSVSSDLLIDLRIFDDGTVCVAIRLP